MHVGSPPLLETEVDGCRRAQRQEITQRVHQEWKGRLKVNAVGGKDDVGLEVDDLLRQWFAPRYVRRRLPCLGCPWARREAEPGKVRCRAESGGRGHLPVQYYAHDSVLEAVQSDVVLHQCLHLQLVGDVHWSVDLATHRNGQADKSTSGSELKTVYSR